MICPKCKSLNVYVTDTRGNDTNTVDRRRKCADCQYAFWTHEEMYPGGKRQDRK